jgi:acetyltransferase
MVNTAPGIHFTLDDGSPEGMPAFARLLRPDDRDALIAGFKRLSPEARRLRFLGPIKRLTESQLHYLTENDNVDRLAWAAADMRHGEHFGIGLARYCRDPEDTASAEFAVTVVDGYQRMGLGTRLLDLLAGSAAANGIRIFRGYVSCENTPMIRLLSRRCAVLRPAWGRVLLAEFQLDDSDCSKDRASSVGPAASF